MVALHLHNTSHHLLILLSSIPILPSVVILFSHRSYHYPTPIGPSIGRIHRQRVCAPSQSLSLFPFATFGPIFCDYQIEFNPIYKRPKPRGRLVC
ncbi:hypothetical protein F4774DRAFT_27901 [Daldinia eschscholtzii]|nr:hypothetical protein F4774DRAFT_27901 [Daldinia eschscholtzii]